MYAQQKISRHFLLVLSSVYLGLSPILSADALESAIAQLPHTNTPVVQSPPAPTPSRQTPRQRRPRTAFFEEERRQFGFGNFLSSALDGANNTLTGDPAKLSNFNEARRSALSSTREGSVPGILTILSRDPDDLDFVNITFVDAETRGRRTNIGITGIDRSEDPRIGSLRIGSTVEIGSPVNQLLPLDPTTNSVIINDVAVPVINNTVTVDGQTIPVTIRAAQINGQPIPFNVRIYNVGATPSGDRVSGVVLITNPDDPSTSIFIQLPPTNIPDADDNDPVSGPAFLSIGRPTDR